jgi:pyruvate/2-oxoglutarate dehydrogenase complex dihydrolipoamide dehydrogenase (E3) component
MSGHRTPATDPVQPIEPWDEFNRALVSHVRPHGWVNPRPLDRYDLVVLGGGTGGLVTTAIAVALGARVALVERAYLGGDCLVSGCVPSKAVIRAARGWRDAATAAARFGAPAAEGDGDFAAVMARMRRIRAEIAPHDSAARFRDLGAHVFLGEARFVTHDAVEVDGSRLRFRRAVIATGTVPAVPPIPGLAGSGYLTSDDVFSLTELPRRLGVVGGGPIGCELAQAFARFGSEVTVLERSDRILPRDDEGGARLVLASLERDGVRFMGRTGIDEVTRDADEGATRVSSRQDGDPRSVVVDRLLVSTGRVPALDALDLAAAGIEASADGVAVDGRLRTSNRRVFAVGDVCTATRFTHVADAHARLVVRNALFHGRGRVDSLIVPWCTYTAPELAHVGIPAAEAADRDDVDTLTVPLEDTDRARIDGESDGFFRVHLEPGSDRILGATLVAGRAGELIGQVTQAMVAGIGLGRMGESIHPYPSRTEVFRRAADELRRRKLTPRARRIFDWYFRLTR